MLSYRIAGRFSNHASFRIFRTHTNLQKLEPSEIIARDYEIARLFLACQLFVYYGAPDAPVNMVGAYHRLGW